MEKQTKRKADDTEPNRKEPDRICSKTGFPEQNAKHCCRDLICISTGEVSTSLGRHAYGENINYEVPREKSKIQRTNVSGTQKYMADVAVGAALALDLRPLNNRQ